MMRVLDDHLDIEGRDAALDAILDLGLSPTEAIPGLMLAIRNLLERLDWDEQGQAWDEALGLLEDDHEENLLP